MNETNPAKPQKRSPPSKALVQARRRHVVAQFERVSYVDLAPMDAWHVLGFPSRHALWAFLRRHETEGEGHVNLAGGAVGYRRGRRWIVRIPRENPLTDNVRT